MNNQIKTLCETIFNKLVYIDKKYPDVMELTQYTDFSYCVLSSDLCLANMYYTDTDIDMESLYFELNSHIQYEQHFFQLNLIYGYFPYYIYFY